MDALSANHVLGRSQNFVLLEVKLCQVRCDQHAVVWRHHHVTLWQTVAQGAFFDQDRLEVRVLHQLLASHLFAANPCNLLNAVVTCDDPVAFNQFFDQTLAFCRRDCGARRKAWDHILDFREGHRGPVKEGHNTLFRIVWIVSDEVNVRASQVKDVIVALVWIFTALDNITAVTTKEDVRVQTTIKRVCTCATSDRVFAVEASDSVVAVTTFNDVVAEAAVQAIVTVAA